MVATARLAEVKQLAEHQAEQLRDLIQQRDALQARGERHDSDLAALRERLQTQERTAASEREALQQHARAVEERAHQEVDRARQDAKALRTQLEQLQRERQALEQEYRQREEGSRRGLAEVQRELTMQTARAGASVGDGLLEMAGRSKPRGFVGLWGIRVLRLGLPVSRGAAAGML